MRRYATANATDKNISSGPASEGEAVGVVTDQVGRVVGTPESPLEVFQSNIRMLSPASDVTNRGETIR